MAKKEKIQIGDIIEFERTSKIRTKRTYTGRVTWIASSRKWCIVADTGIVATYSDGTKFPLSEINVPRDDILGNKTL